MNEPIVIDVQNLTKQYQKQIAVREAGFQVKRSSICGLIGPNGAGKTTIMKMLGGLVIPTSGSMSIYGSRTERELVKARERMSIMIETPYAKLDLTAQQNLEKQRLQKGIPGKNRIDEVMELVGLPISKIGKKRLKEYSLGMRQRFGLANALLSKPEIMILDEPVNGLDPEGIVELRELFLQLNKKEDVTILISSHILSELSLMCDDYVFIVNGSIVKHLTRDALERECQSYLHIHTDQDALALAILQERLQVERIAVEEDGSIRLFELLDDIALVSRTLYENGVLPLSLSMGGENLEQYYMTLIGGEADVEYHSGAVLPVGSR